jgi:hypothetical protein
MRRCTLILHPRAAAAPCFSPLPFERCEGPAAYLLFVQNPAAFLYSCFSPFFSEYNISNENQQCGVNYGMGFSS